MRMRWLGITGLVLILTALAMQTAGPWMFPNAFMGDRSNPMMGTGMMGSSASGDPNQPFDQRFLDDMILHHQGAVISTQMMIANSTRPELRDLAQRIITGQQREIDQMRQWRQSWYGAPSVSDTQARMMDQMMGANADFDQMFLQMMIPHHEAAVAMVEQALMQAEHPELKTLAQTIITTQRAEITEMRGYLRDWYGANGS